MYNKALDNMNDRTYTASSIEEMKEIIDTKPGFIKAEFCGCPECEKKLKELTGIKSRCILENEKPITGKCVICGKECDNVTVWGIQY